jgi:integrase
MAKYKRHKTNYPGVYFIEGKSPLNSKLEKIYYIKYYQNGKPIEEKVGRQFKDNMTPAKASQIRILKATGKMDSNRERRMQINNRITLDYLFEVFCNHKRHLRSLHDDIIRYNKHVKQVVGKKKVPEIEPVDLYKLRDKLTIDHKPATVKQVLVLIQRIVNFGNSLQLCPRFTFKIDMPKFDNKKTEDLTETQYKSLLDVLDEYETYHPDSVAIMRLALFTGMRKGEILGLKWDDVDFDRGFIYISESEAKSKKAEMIPMNDTARSVLESVMEYRRSDYVFPNREGKRLEATSYKNHFYRIREKAGLPDTFRPMHGLRHTFASSLASTGEVDMYTLQRLLTHKSPQMTQRYAHLKDDTLKRASRVTDTLVNNIQEKSPEE